MVNICCYNLETPELDFDRVVLLLPLRKAG